MAQDQQRGGGPEDEGQNEPWGGTRQAGEDAVRAWARAARLDLAGSDSIPLAIIAAYNRAHPDRPY